MSEQVTVVQMNKTGRSQGDFRPRMGRPEPEVVEAPKGLSAPVSAESLPDDPAPVAPARRPRMGQNPALAESSSSDSSTSPNGPSDLLDKANKTRSTVPTPPAPPAPPAAPSLPLAPVNGANAEKVKPTPVETGTPHSSQSPNNGKPTPPA